MNSTSRTTALVAAAAAAAAALALGGGPSSASAHERPAHQRAATGHVYEATNDAGANALTVFDRYADGSLRRVDTVATGGIGTGTSLNSQGGVARDGRVLFVVNAGDDSVSALAVTSHGLELRDRISSHGDHPVSVTVKDGVGYVPARSGSCAVRRDSSRPTRRVARPTRRRSRSPRAGALSSSPRRRPTRSTPSASLTAT